MKNTVRYEWKLETIDPRDLVDDMESDIIDIEHSDKLSDLYPCQNNQRVCLVRDVGNEDHGLQERDHAYILSGSLAIETVEDGHHVPKRFHSELARLK